MRGRTLTVSLGEAMRVAVNGTQSQKTRKEQK